jgi:hypothetical protein
MVFRGCPRPLGSTILLHGSDAGELRRVKRVAVFAAYAAYWGGLETALLSDQLAAAAAAVLLGGAQEPDAVAGLADAVASSSFLATAEARGRQTILSASPHVSVVLEAGVSGRELELLPPAAAEGEWVVEEQQEPGSSDAAWEDDAAAAAAEPSSPGSSDSTDMWALPAEAAAATFTVSGSQSQAEAVAGEEERQQQGLQGQQEQQGGKQLETQYSGSSETGEGTPLSRDDSTDALAAPGSPQDPLHLAAKELALQQLQLTGSEPPSPAAAAGPDAAAAEQTDQLQPQQPPASLARLSSEIGGAAVPQPSAPRDAAAGAAAAAAATALAAQQQEAAAVEQGRAASSAAPGTAPYRSQQLWLAISCKNPAKGILCEPSHEHCMQFYADTGGPGSGCPATCLAGLCMALLVLSLLAYCRCRAA